MLKTQEPALRRGFRPEILAPAGNLFKLKTAVRYGADAVYLAGRRFGLRSAADNFSIGQIREGCRFAHERGAKVYVVLNGFLFDEELAQLPLFLDQLAAAAVDAVIVSDLGVLATVRAHGGLTLHLSTQASTLNTYGARFWRRMGVKRIVLGREVTIEEAARIKRDAEVEVELFAHGAMCMAYSGHCTISNYTAGRDSNRGGCIQSCRFQYRLSSVPGGPGPENFFLSSKDLRGIDQMASFSRHEIDSLKIEGRMKSALYVATATHAYVRARDGLPKARNAFGFDELDSFSHRDYTSGSLVERAGPSSVYLHGEDEVNHSHEFLGWILDLYPPDSMAVLLKVKLTAGQVVELMVPHGENVSIPTGTMKNLSGEPLAEAHPNQVVLLPYHPHARDELLLRKPLHAQALRHAPTLVRG